VLQAAAQGTLRHTDYDDPAQAGQRAHAAAPTFAQQAKAGQSHG